jgi:hypothetical protein
MNNLYCSKQVSLLALRERNGNNSVGVRRAELVAL